ncbi:hypothetical protein [Bradyrhizobium sp. USDA 10063]
MIQAEEDVVKHMLASLTSSALQSRIAPTDEQVAYHFRLACEKAGLIPTDASTIRILKRLSREVRKAQSVLDFIDRSGAQLQ